MASTAMTIVHLKLTILYYTLTDQASDIIKECGKKQRISIIWCRRIWRICAMDGRVES
jgi:hypothetical protein